MPPALAIILGLITITAWLVVIVLMRQVARESRQATANHEAATRNFEYARELQLKTARLRAERLGRS